MNRILVILFILLPITLYAGVIIKTNGDRLEDVSVKAILGSDIHLCR